MLCSAAVFPSLDSRSFITANLRPAVQRAASFLFLGPLSSGLRGYELSNRVDSESITIRLVFSGGKDDWGWMNIASRCARVGVV